MKANFESTPKRAQRKQWTAQDKKEHKQFRALRQSGRGRCAQYEDGDYAYN